MKEDKHIAEKFCNTVLNKYPRAKEWEQVFLKEKDSSDLKPQWPDWCPLPMAATYAMLSPKGPVDTSNYLILEDMPNLTAALTWTHWKMIYRFDATLQHELENQPGLDKLPLDPLFHLPYPCIYIDAPGVLETKKTTMGFFAWMEFDVNNHTPELRLLYLYPDKTTRSIPLILAGDTLDECVRAFEASAYSRALNQEMRDTLAEGIKQTGGFHFERDIMRALQLILYLCSDAISTDVVPQSPIEHRNPTSKRDNRPKTPITWNVGTRIGSTIRASYRTEHTPHASGGEHASPRPHMRRAHWHHFWTGSRNDPESRKMVLHWIPPVAVGIDVADDSTTVIHPVKK